MEFYKLLVYITHLHNFKTECNVFLLYIPIHTIQMHHFVYMCEYVAILAVNLNVFSCNLRYKQQQTIH